MKVCKLLGILALVSLSVDAEASGCTDYTLLENPKRCTAYEMQLSDSPIQDYYTIVEGLWYRFLSNGYDVDIPERVRGVTVPFGYCGTQIPIWIEGNNTHPSGSQITEAKVCASYGVSSCDWNANINIQLCEEGPFEFYVYKLARPETMQVAYCAGEKMTCPRGQWYNSDLRLCIDMSTKAHNSTLESTTSALNGTSTFTSTKTTRPASLDTSSTTTSTPALSTTNPGTTSTLSPSPSTTTTKDTEATVGTTTQPVIPVLSTPNWIVYNIITVAFCILGVIAIIVLLTKLFGKKRKTIDSEEKREIPTLFYLETTENP